MTASTPTPPPAIDFFAALRAEGETIAMPLRAAITDATRRDEQTAVAALLAGIERDPGRQQRTAELARKLVAGVREERRHGAGVDALMHEFALSSQEGVALMCLAEALLRIPDAATADRLIAEKVSRGNWREHLGESSSLFVNAAAWGLLITGKLVATTSEQGLSTALSRLIAKGGEPVIRQGMHLAMRLLGNKFVTGRSIEEALANSRKHETRGYAYSYDMLGEAALTDADAERYFDAYEAAIHAIGQASAGRGIKNGPGISVKLSALHPRYSRAQRATVLAELLPRLQHLVALAKHYDIGINIDAEEADRLELSLDLLEALAFDSALAGFDGIGFVVQAYQKRCPFVIDYLVDLARRSGRRFMVRLVKGAYWDTEIKRAQVDGMPGYPVYTRKVYTDVSYLACAQKLLHASALLYPQFATHNAQTLAAIHTLASDLNVADYEFQCLHGMGESLYDRVVGPEHLNRRCRIYAPVGPHETLLAYLVRRLLENGANSSFVNRIVDEAVSIEELIADPVEAAAALAGAPHPQIPLPSSIYLPQRSNSAGLDLSDENTLRELAAASADFANHSWQAAPLIAANALPDTARNARDITNPADRRDVLGQVIEADPATVATALAAAFDYAPRWQGTTPAARASLLRQAADLLEQHRLELILLAMREAGKTAANAVAEVREAVDFLRYYATQAAADDGAAPLGPVACISPWNFPLAIFTGQVAASLAAGNVVLAKPAEQTPLIAQRAVELLHAAGVPRAALQYLPGTGETVGAALVADPRVRGVVFTGSTEVANLIHRTLARRALDEGGEIALIAETGGQNAMVVDSSALAEQVVQDVLSSAFDSAGQRCSALRILCLQEDIAEHTIAMLKGAMQRLRIGATGSLATDVGPVIDDEARAGLLAHIEQARSFAKDVFQLPLPAACAHGSFVAPTLIEIDSIARLTREVFGPVLHVVRYPRRELGRVIDAINASGYGLTFGIHSRIDETIAYATERIRAGNVYVNRNIVGAVVGVQPFGGEGKSGTGPKAGGPLYLWRLQREPVAGGDRRRLQGCTQAAVEHAWPPAGNAALEAFIGWADAGGRADLARLAKGYGADTLTGAGITLRSPTGERDVLHCRARGGVLCLADEQPDLLRQIAAVLATGNRALLPSFDLVPADLPPSVRERLALVDESLAGVDIALASSARAGAERCALAARADALIPVIEQHADGSLPLWRLSAEQTVCVNTTASGGNASLMALDA